MKLWKICDCKCRLSGILDCKCFNIQEYLIANVPPLNQLGGVPRVHYTHWGPIWRWRKKCFFNLSMFSRKIRGKGKLIFHGFPLSFLHFCPGCIVLWLARIDWKWIWVWGFAHSAAFLIKFCTGLFIFKLILLSRKPLIQLYTCPY